MMIRQVQDIQYQLLPGTQRRTTDIVIERDGTVTVRPPSHLTPQQIDETVFSKRMWIYRNLAEWRERNASRVHREWVNGESFLYLGNCYRLQIVNDQQQLVELKGDRLCLSRAVIESNGQSGARQALIVFYQTTGLPLIQKRVSGFTEKVGVTARSVQIKDLGHRWATCSKKADLHFHWKTLMAPLTIIDYLIVHELCHLHYRDHSIAFWNEVDKILPDYQERKNWLRVEGAGLDL